MEWIDNRYLFTEYFKKTKFSQYFGFPVKDIIKLCRFHQGEQIIESDIISDFIYFLLDGEVKFLVTSDSGKIVYLGGCKEFTVLGEVSSLSLLQNAYVLAFHLIHIVIVFWMIIHFYVISVRQWLTA